MKLAVVWVAPLAGPPNVSPGRLVELITRYVTAADRVEHITARDQYDHMAVFGFFLADPTQDPRQKLTRLARSATTNELTLAHWRVV